MDTFAFQMTNTAFILYGGNLGNVSETFNGVTHSLLARGVKITGESALYASPPWGFESDSWFLNCVVMIETSFTASELLKVLLEVEEDHGRIRDQEEGYHSRTIDLDILLFNDDVIDDEDLSVPHPRMHQRRFTMLPLAELAPEHPHPILKHTMQELLDACEDRSEVKKVD